MIWKKTFLFIFLSNTISLPIVTSIPLFEPRSIIESTLSNLQHPRLHNPPRPTCWTNYARSDIWAPIRENKMNTKKPLDRFSRQTKKPPATPKNRTYIHTRTHTRVADRMPHCPSVYGFQFSPSLPRWKLHPTSRSSVYSGSGKKLSPRPAELFSRPLTRQLAYFYRRVQPSVRAVARKLLPRCPDYGGRAFIDGDSARLWFLAAAAEASQQREPFIAGDRRRA